MPNHLTRRRTLHTLAGSAACLALPALGVAAMARVPVAEVSEGPFYPPARWRERQGTDWDADLTRVQRGSQVLQAQGEVLGLGLALVDTQGRPLDGAEVEIWQCDALAHYHHPRVPRESGRFDEGFQGFGAARTDASGQVRMRTIRPVPYPGRTPHIHAKLRHPSFGEWTTQLFIAGDAGNAGDFLWRRLAAAQRTALELVLKPGAAGSGLRWQSQHALTLPA